MSTKTTIKESLRNKVQHKVGKVWVVLYSVSIGATGFVVAIDKNKDFKNIIKDLFKHRLAPTTSYNLISEYRRIDSYVLTHINGIREILTTLSTILTAAVVFFYSVQDNKKAGVPHRRIMAYTVGRYTIPITYVVSLLLSIIQYIIPENSAKYALYTIIAIGFIYQISIIIMIMYSTSFQFGVKAIYKAEKKQYKCLSGKEMTEKQENILLHMEQAIISNELITDKVRIIDIILRAPHYNASKLKVKNRKICIEKMDCELLYYFYYKNVESSLSHLVEENKGAERKRIYTCICEFMDELKDAVQNKVSDDIVNNYLIIISAFLNAVQYSCAPESHGFCRDLIEKHIEEYFIPETIVLNILYQEILYRIKPKAITQEYIQMIKIIKPDSLRKIINIKRCEDFWDIWASTTTMRPEDRTVYKNDAIANLFIMYGKSSIISYINK